MLKKVICTTSFNSTNNFFFAKIKESFPYTPKKPHNVAFNYSFMNKLGAV